MNMLEIYIKNVTKRCTKARIGKLFWRQCTFDVMKIARQFPNLSTFSLDLELPCDLHAFFHSSRNAPCELRRFDFICYMLCYAIAYAYAIAIAIAYAYAIAIAIAYAIAIRRKK